MELKQLNVKGFKRFHEPTKLDLFGRLVALVGPNEAGKSSILKALTYLGNDTPILDTELSRGEKPETTEISATFYLEKEDLNEAALHVPTSLKIIKQKNGPREYKLAPIPPQRDLQRRNEIITQIRRVTANKKLSNNLETNNPDFPNLLNTLATQLENSPEDLPPAIISQLEAYSILLNQHLTMKAPLYATNLQNGLTALAKLERQLNPKEFALSELKKLIPEFLEFTDDQRKLETQYDLTVAAGAPPIPLKNLASIAQLNLQALFRTGDDWGIKEELLADANKRLQKAFKETWSQSGIHAHFRVEGNILRILIKDEEGRYNALGERSDGLRQFVALQAFTTMEHATNRPILLIDEAELHLHYDGQADLVQMLTKQPVTDKVIYSTHSAGCLPEDLGVGIRLVVPDATDLTSKIRNKFWGTHQQGFSALLIGMGATTLAFFPTRYALVAEGPTEMLLLPTLFRQATDQAFLGFQVVHGLSETSLAALPATEASGPRVAYYVDADDGGDKIRHQLTKKLNVNPSRILSVNRPEGESYTTEDLIDPNYFTKAVNNLLELHHPDTPKVTSSDISSPDRVKKLKQYCSNNNIRPIEKIDIAYQLLDFVGTDPSAVIIDSNFKKELSKMYETIISELEIVN